MSPLWHKEVSGRYCGMPPKDLRAAVEDVVAFCTYLKNYYRNLQQGATSQLLVLCNRYCGAQLATPTWLPVYVVWWAAEM